MKFHNPNLFLHLLWLLPILFMVVYFGYSSRKKKLHMFISRLELAHELSRNLSSGKRRWREILLFLGCIFLIVALAGPHWGTKLVNRPSHSRDLLVVLDTSKSMLATDVSPSRLKHAKWFISQLTDRTPGDRYGLIAFAGTAFLECPLTQDRSSFLLFLDDIDTNTIPVGGTNIEAALTTALEAFAAAEGRHRAIILVTDGEEVQGESSSIFTELTRRKIPIYVVGIGDPNLGAYIQVDGNKFITDLQGNRVKTKLNETALQRIAATVGGTYVHSTVVHDGVDHVLDKIRNLIPEQQEESTVSRPIERYQMPLLLGILCLLARLIIGERTRSEKSAQPNPETPFNSPSEVLSLILLGLIANAIIGTPILYSQDQSGLTPMDQQSSTDPHDDQPILIDPRKMPVGQHHSGAIPPGTPPPTSGQHLLPPGAQISHEKSKMINQSITRLKERLETAKEPQELAYLHYNLGVNLQLLGNFLEAEKHYNQAIDFKSNNELISKAYQNLGVLKHQHARENIASDTKKAKVSLQEAQDYYREAMRISPHPETIAGNQEMALEDKMVIEQMEKMMQEAAQQQQNAKDKAEDALKAQQEANQAVNADEKQEKQKEAQQKTEAAEEAVQQLTDSARDAGQKQASDWLQQAADKLSEAREKQQQAIEESGEENTAQQSHGEEAEQLISQALNQLGGNPKNREDDQTEAGEMDEDDEKDSMASNENQEEKEDQGDNQKQVTKGQKGDNENEDTEGKDMLMQNLNQMQALRILDDLQQSEKDLKQELKQLKKQQMKETRVEKDW